MSREVVFRRIARAEFDEAVAWYEGERAGLGLEFKAAVEERLVAIALQPGLFRQVRGPVRRAVLNASPIRFISWMRVRESWCWPSTTQRVTLRNWPGAINETVGSGSVWIRTLTADSARRDSAEHHAQGDPQANIAENRTQGCAKGHADTHAPRRD